MDDENKRLLNRVQKDRLKKALRDGDEKGTAFKEAMDVTEKLNNIDKLNTDHQEQIEKLEAEHKLQMEKLEAENKLQMEKLEAENKLQMDKLEAEHQEQDKQRKKEFKRNIIVTAVTSIAAPLFVMTAKFFFGRSNMRLVGGIEQYETPVTTPGKSHHKHMIDDYRL